MKDFRLNEGKILLKTRAWTKALDDYTRKASRQRRQKMNSANTRKVETTISMSNIVSQIEELLRRYKVISDNEEIRGFEFGDVVGDGVNIKFKAVREEV